MAAAQPRCSPNGCSFVITMILDLVNDGDAAQAASAGLTWVDWVSLVSAAATVAGLLLTIRVFRDVKKLQARYVFLGRVPELLDRITDQNSTVNRLVGAFPESQEQIRHELTICRANLRSMRGKLNSGLQASLDGVDALIVRAVEANPMSRDEVWAVYSGISGLVIEIHNDLADRSWEA